LEVERKERESERVKKEAMIADSFKKKSIEDTREINTRLKQEKNIRAKLEKERPLTPEGMPPPRQQNPQP